MTVIIKFADWVDAFTEAVGGKFTAVLVIITVVVGFYNVVARYTDRYTLAITGVKLSSNLFLELQWYLFSFIFFLGFAYILKHQVNVRVDFLAANWTPQQRAWVDLLGHLLFLVPFCIMGIYVTLDPVMRSWGLLADGSWGTWEVSPDPNGLPRAPIKTMIIVSFALLALQALAECVKCVAVIIGYRRDFVLHEDMNV